MVHYQQLKWIELTSSFFQFQDRHDLSVLEIGSYNVNGTVREFFPDTNYIGVDLIEGAGVDVVGDGHTINMGEDHFDVTLSCESFEHNPYWQETFENMHRMTKPAGFVIFTCASKGRVEHGTNRTDLKDSPGSNHLNWDYYNNLTETDFQTLSLTEMFAQHAFFYNKHSRDLYFVGQKNDRDSSKTIKWSRSDLMLHTQAAFSPTPRSNLENLFRSVTDLPINIAGHILPDAAFQNLAVPYSNLRRRVAEAIINKRQKRRSNDTSTSDNPSMEHKTLG